MVKYFTWAMALACLLMMPLFAYPQSESEAPPVSQPLVAEGTFALQLASALKMPNATNETEAEDILAKAGIAPQNGWITDYPVTPQVLGEVRNSMLSAIDSGRLSMPKDAALQAFGDVTNKSGLAISPATGMNPENQSAATAPEPDQNAIDNYYYNQGPPPITYYPPPLDYGYLYDWYPYPFYGYGAYFPGFYMLNDFSFFGGFGHFHDHGHFDNGHFFAHHNHGFHNGADHGFHSFEARNGAHTIFNDHSFRGGSFNDHSFRGGSVHSGFSHGSMTSHGMGFRGGSGGFHNGGFSHGSMGGIRSGGFSHGSMGGFHGSGGFSHGSMGGFHGGGFGGGHGGGFGGGHGGGHR